MPSPTRRFAPPSDDLRGSVHRAYGLLAFNAALVRADGVLVHREEWASAEQLRGALANVRRWDERRAAGVLLYIGYGPCFRRACSPGGCGGGRGVVYRGFRTREHASGRWGADVAPCRRPDDRQRT